ARYVWQLLTGSDPVTTAGAEILHGPRAHAYRRFVAEMTPETHAAAGYVAQRLLARERINEPVYYSPEYDPDTRLWLPGTAAPDYLPDLSRDGFRATSRALELAAAQSRDP